MEKMISLEKDASHIVTSEVREKLAGKKISASMITGLEGCHTKWLADSFVIKDIVGTPEDGANVRGTLFHRVMELFFDLPPAERTVESMKTIVDNTLHEPEYQHFLTNHDAIYWLREAVDGYYAMGGNPQKVKIATLTDDKGRERSGLEMFVTAHVGNTSRPSLGFVDQIQQDPRDSEAVIVQDWKSGKAKHWSPKKPFEEGYPEQRQQILYSMILEKMGHKVSAAQLVYPIAGHVERVRLSNQTLRERVVHDVEWTDRTLDEFLETNEFSYKPTFLCSWCPLVKICPSAYNGERYGKVQVAYDTQPEAEVLSEGIEVL